MPLQTRTAMLKFNRNLLGHDQKPTLALVLEDSTRSALDTAAQAIAESPDEWLGVPGMAFEPEAKEQFHMVFVLCTDRLCHLPSEDLQTLHDDVRRHVSAASAEGPLPLICRGFELFGPDKSHLIARFRAPTQLVQLRRAIWRTCKDFGVAFPDALWAPHIRLGRIKASRGQLKQVAFSKLPAQLSELAIEPSGLTLSGKRPEDPYCDCDWDIALFSCPPRPDAKDAVAEVRTIAKVPSSQGMIAPVRTQSATEAVHISDAHQSEVASAPEPVLLPKPDFVAELPKLRRPLGEPGPARPGRRPEAQ